VIELTDEERAFLVQVLERTSIQGRPAMVLILSVMEKLEKKG